MGKLLGEDAMITLADVWAARQVVRPYTLRTPLLRSSELSQRARGDVYLKPESWQFTGSFKIRGALNKFASMSPEELERGIVTASAGNHGLGVAYAGQALGLSPAVIFVPETTPQTKLRRLAAFPCEIHQVGADYDSTHAVADAYARDRGATYLSAYDDPIVVAGQGTVGLEITEDEPDVDVLLVPVGGGGLVAGMAVVAKALKPSVQIIGVQPEASPSAFLSLRDGHPYETFPAAPTICDGLAGGFGKVPFQIAADLIDEILIIPEADVRHAVGWLLMHEQMVVEGSGAIAVAPLLSGRLDLAGGRAVAVLTGRNLESKLMRSILEEQMMEETG